MLFCAYLGNDKNLLLWKEMVYRHASWIGLTPHLETRHLYSCISFSFGWLKTKSFDRNSYIVETEQYLIIDTLGYINQLENMKIDEELPQQLIQNINTNAIRLGLSLQSGNLSVVVPATTPEQFYYANDSRGYAFGNDLRLLIRWAGLELDENTIYALFQYGAAPPPFTISKNVKRIPGGHIFSLESSSNKLTCKVFFKQDKELQKEGSSRNPEVQVRETLDNILAHVPESTVLYFSGGVDSSLLAARLAEMGRMDIKLLNYAFGPQDQAGHLALQIAAHLGLSCEQVMYKSSDLPVMLERLGKDYSFPSEDASVIVQNLLVHASLRSVEQSLMVINGIGADGAFRMLPSPIWNQIASTPGLIQWMIAKGYKWLKLWKYDSKVERHANFYRRSVQMPLQHAAIIAHNPLDGIAYTIPTKIRDNLEETISSRVQVLGAELEPREKSNLLDLVYVCAGRYAVVTFDPLRTRGVKSIYPFLEPPMLHLSLSLQWNDKCANGEPKALLKKILASSLPRELVYRPKNYFFPPIKEILTCTSMQEFIRNVVMSQENPLLNFCQVGILRQMLERSRLGHPLSKQAYRFLWTLMFTSGWLHQAEL